MSGYFASSRPHAPVAVIPRPANATSEAKCRNRIMVLRAASEPAPLRPLRRKSRRCRQSSASAAADPAPLNPRLIRVAGEAGKSHPAACTVVNSGGGFHAPDEEQVFASAYVSVPGGGRLLH